jgi:hypothetical protein
MKLSSALLRFATPLLLSVSVNACGGGDAPAKSADDANDSERGRHEDAEGMSASAEIGALDEVKVDRTFGSTLPGLERCLHTGARRVEFIGGKVSFYIEVDSAGSLSQARFEESTLGDLETEKCMLAALRAKRWPKPVGGEKGYARKSFDFDPPNDVRPPTDWDSDRVQETLEKIGPDIEACKAGSPGRFQVTLYVGTDGTPLSVGVSPPDEDGQQALDCLANVLKSAEFPSPGSWPAKVGFEL